MRVDWARNMVPTYRFHVMLTQMSDSFVVQANDPADPKRFRFERDEEGKLDYFETVTRSQFFPDIYSLLGYNGPGYFYDSPAVMLDLRHSFVRADMNEVNDFEPVHMPPSVVLEDEDGNEVRDENGYAKRVKIRDRFGLYSTNGRFLWDANRGAVDAGRQWHATVFDIWEQTHNADGTLIPVEEREPKPIEYWTNVTHPKQLMDASKNRVGAQWNDVFRNAVYLAQTTDVANPRYTSIDDVPEMFIVHENDCNPTNVQDVFNGLPAHIKTQVELAAAEPETGFNGRIDDIVERYDWANSIDTEEPFTIRQTTEIQALEDLERVCTAMEYYTDPMISGDDTLTQFTYQRYGDVRYSMLNLIMQDHNNGWLGYGPMLGDPVTGRTIQATANIAVTILDNIVERIVQSIDAMNGIVTPGDLISGQDIQGYMRDKMMQNSGLTTYKPTDDARDAMRRRLDRLGPADDALKETPPNSVEQRLSRLRDTPYEHLLIHPQDAIVYGGVDPVDIATQGATLSLDEALLEELSPARGLLKKKAHNQDEMLHRLAMRTMDMPEYADSFIFGLATRFKDIEDRRERFERIRTELYVAVQLHEVGHNVGLYHNFEASSDALNYGERFWRLQEYDADMDTALGDNSIPDEERALISECITNLEQVNDRLVQQGREEVVMTTQQCLSQTEAMYSSIMDYHGTRNGDFNGLGPYDYAAIKFAYGKVLEVFPDANLELDPATDDLGKWTYYNDWRNISSDFVSSASAVNERDHVKYEWGPASTRMEPPANEVPYRFCYGGFYGNTPWCQVFDFGPDMRTNAQLLLNNYYNSYFFTHFNRGRLWEYGPDINGPIGADARIMGDFTKKMQWYVFMSMTDPDFKGSYAEEDFLATTLIGLNHLGHVIGQPGSGYMTTVPQYQVAGMYDENPQTADDRLAPGDIAIPWSWQGQCEAIAIAQTDDNTGFPVAGNPGFTVGRVPLGDGRPFFLGLTEDYEEWYVTYVGNYWAKWDALLYLGYNRAWFPRTNWDVDPRFFDISWYRLFPEEVGQVVSSIVSEHEYEIGPVISPDGTYSERDLVDLNTGEAPDYTGYARVRPSIAFNHQYLAMAYAHALMSSQWDNEIDFYKSFEISVDGAQDDTGSFDIVRQNAIDNGEDPADYVAEFTHPLSGQTMMALKAGRHPVAYNTLNRVGQLKKRWERLKNCVDNPDLADGEGGDDDPYCYCVQVVEERPNGTFCTDPYLEPPGVGQCAQYDLTRRADSARERMDDLHDFLDDMRGFNAIFSQW
jgi:hypothetical protein